MTDLPKLRLGSDAVSPTAHYTGHVWVRNGLSHPELATWEGRAMFNALEPAMVASRALGGPTLEGLLLARHRIIDDLLTRAIEERDVRQVIEPACGMSPRGWRFCDRYGEALTYIEGDLRRDGRPQAPRPDPDGCASDSHRVVDARTFCVTMGPRASRGSVTELDADEGLAIVTEGLLTYLEERQVIDVWRRFARATAPFAGGTYLADIRLGGRNGDLTERSFGVALSFFVRGRVHRHFADSERGLGALREAGYRDAAAAPLRPASRRARASPRPGARRVRDRRSHDGVTCRAASSRGEAREGIDLAPEGPDDLSGSGVSPPSTTKPTVTSPA